MRECPTLAFVTAFSLITNICSNLTQRRLDLPKHSMRVLEVNTSNISKSFFKDHYRVYDGSVEGIRNACESDGQKCYFHAYVQTDSKVLNPDGVILM